MEKAKKKEEKTSYYLDKTSVPIAIVVHFHCGAELFYILFKCNRNAIA